MTRNYFIFLLVYFAGLLLLNFLFSRKMKRIEDFFLASRNLPGSLVFLSMAASWLGAASVLASVDQAYSDGLRAFWIIGMPAVLTVLIFAIFLARRIRELPFITLPELIEQRYGRTVRHMSSILIIWYMIVLASSQMVALGSFFKVFLGTSYFTGLLIGVSIVLVYSVFGGFLSIVITDTLQFFILALGLIGLFIYLLTSFPVKTLSQIASGLGKHSYFDFFANAGHSVLVMFSFLLAWLISPITWQRIQSSRTVKGAQKALAASSIAFVLLYGCIVGIGMLSLLCFPEGIQEGPLLSAIILTKTGKLLGILLFLAVVAAIMSTMDTAINTGALSLARDVFQQIIPKWSQKRVVALSRSATLITGALAFIIASRLQDILKTLGLASEIMAEGLFIPGLAMLFIRKKYPLAGLFSLILGGGYSTAGFLCELNILNFSWPEWPQSVPYGVILSFSGFMLGLFLSSRKRTIHN